MGRVRSNSRRGKARRRLADAEIREERRMVRIPRPAEGFRDSERTFDESFRTPRPDATQVSDDDPGLHQHGEQIEQGRIDVVRSGTANQRNRLTSESNHGIYMDGDY